MLQAKSAFQVHGMVTRPLLSKESHTCLSGSMLANPPLWLSCPPFEAVSRSSSFGLFCGQPLYNTGHVRCHRYPPIRKVSRVVGGVGRPSTNGFAALSGSLPQLILVPVIVPCECAVAKTRMVRQTHQFAKLPGL